MSKDHESVDYNFIQTKIIEKTPVAIFLVNGVKLNGAIYEQDSISIVCSGKDGKQQLVFKRNISTIT